MPVEGWILSCGRTYVLSSTLSSSLFLLGSVSAGLRGSIGATATLDQASSPISSTFSLSRTNSSLLMIYVFETYEIWILEDLWITILRVIPSLIYLSITNIPYEVRWPAGGLRIPDRFKVLPLVSSRMALIW